MRKIPFFTDMKEFALFLLAPGAGLFQALIPREKVQSQEKILDKRYK